MSAVEIAKRLDIDRSTVHRQLAILLQMEKVESKNGIWFAKTVEQTIKPLEKEIVIELPIPENEWQRIVLLEEAAKTFGGTNSDNIFKTSLEKLKETRTIRITGKNVDDLDMEKIGNLIQQANQKSSLFDFKGLFKKFRMPKRQAPKSSET